LRPLRFSFPVFYGIELQRAQTVFALDSYSLRSLSNQKFWKKALTLLFKINERFIRKSQDFASTAPRAD
jgi:hypothetical protein